MNNSVEYYNSPSCEAVSFVAGADPGKETPAGVWFVAFARMLDCNIST